MMSHMRFRALHDRQDYCMSMITMYQQHLTFLSSFKGDVLPLTNLINIQCTMYFCSCSDVILLIANFVNINNILTNNCVYFVRLVLHTSKINID